MAEVIEVGPEVWLVAVVVEGVMAVSSTVSMASVEVRSSWSSGK